MINDILHVQTISQLPSVWDVGLSSAARGGDLAGAVVGGIHRITGTWNGFKGTK